MTRPEALLAAWLASLADDTPEGKSIVQLTQPLLPPAANPLDAALRQGESAGVP